MPLGGEGLGADVGESAGLQARLEDQHVLAVAGVDADAVEVADARPAAAGLAQDIAGEAELVRVQTAEEAVVAAETYQAISAAQSLDQGPPRWFPAECPYPGRL
ncbi:MAG: hypothetical protein Kilf2KO_45720 [Rhodospirillales bacterium]